MRKVFRILLPTAVVLLTAVLFLLQMCRKDTGKTYCLLPDSIQLHEGDVVFRRGGGMASHAVLLADKEGSYSHCGIVVDSAGTLLVVHAVPGEPDYEGDPDRVKADLPATFFCNVYANAGEVCRTDNDSIAHTAARKAWELYNRKVLFDHDYDSEDSTRLYCTELVYLAYRDAGCTLCAAPAHEFNLPGLHCVCWLPSDLYKSDSLHSVAKF